MEKEEKENLLNSIYPVGKERWIKILILDRDKCMKSFRWANGEEIDNQGYSISAIGLRDEYVPQVSALADLEDDLMPMLMYRLQDYELEQVRNVFKQRKEELKQRVIFTESK